MSKDSGILQPILAFPPTTIAAFGKAIESILRGVGTLAEKLGDIFTGRSHKERMTELNQKHEQACKLIEKEYKISYQKIASEVEIAKLRKMKEIALEHLKSQKEVMLRQIEREEKVELAQIRRDENIILAALNVLVISDISSPAISHLAYSISSAIPNICGPVRRYPPVISQPPSYSNQTIYSNLYLPMGVITPPNSCGLLPSYLLPYTIASYPQINTYPWIPTIPQPPSYSNQIIYSNPYLPMGVIAPPNLCGLLPSYLSPYMDVSYPQINTHPWIPTIPQPQSYLNQTVSVTPAEKELKYETVYSPRQAQDHLIEACKKGDLSSVKDAFLQGAKPYPLDEKDEHPLGAAVFGMNPEVVNEVIEQAGGVALMTWKGCEEHNRRCYKGRVFIVRSLTHLLSENGVNYCIT